MNLRRRNLSEGQKAALALDLPPLLEDQARERQESSRARPGEKVGNVVEKIPPPTDEGKSRDQAAALVGTNPRYISDAKKLKEEAPTLVQPVQIASSSSAAVQATL